MAVNIEGSIIPSAARALLSYLIGASQPLIISRAAVGGGALPSNPDSLTSLVSEVMPGSFSQYADPVDGEARFTVQISSANVATGFNVTEVGIYASDPRTEDELLLAYVSLQDHPQWLRPASAAINNVATFDIIIAVGNVSSITITLDPSSLVSRKDFDDLNGQVTDHVDNNDLHTTADLKAAWSAKYDLPLTGIPANNLDPDLQDVINGALQKNDPIVPNQATADNQLATQNFVNSSIEHMAAHRVTYNATGDAFPTRADLLSATEFFYEGEAYTPTEHDYVIIIADEAAPEPFTDGQTQMEYDGVQWAYAYGVNNEPFTAAEVAAIDSGITAELVQQFKTQADNLQNNKINMVVSDTDIPVALRVSNTFYLIARDSVTIPSDTIVVSPSMGIVVKK